MAALNVSHVTHAASALCLLSQRAVRFLHMKTSNFPISVAERDLHARPPFLPIVYIPGFFIGASPDVSLNANGERDHALRGKNQKPRQLEHEQ
jgi:hypothetical protein